MELPDQSAEGLVVSNYGAEEGSWESLGQQGDQTSQSKRKSALNIHWKYWCWSWNSNTLATWCEELTHWKRPWWWERQEKGTTEDEMVGWHHQLDGHEFEQAPGAGDGKGSLACCIPWGCKESDTTEWLHWNWAHMKYTMFWFRMLRVEEKTTDCTQEKERTGRASQRLEILVTKLDTWKFRKRNKWSSDSILCWNNHLIQTSSYLWWTRLMNL